MPDENGVVEQSTELEQTNSPEPTGEISAEADQTTSGEEFPAEPDKQREAFIQMRQEIKALKSQVQPKTEQIVEEEPQESVLNLFRKGPVYNPDPITEDTELSVITQRMGASEKAAYQAIERVKQLEQEREDERLYTAYPELNPKHPDSKSPKARAMAKYVEGQYLVQSLSNKRPDPVKIAREAEELFAGLSSNDSQKAASDAVAKLRVKEEGSLEAKGRQPLIQPNANIDALRARVRRGDINALAEWNALSIADN